ncbi:HNH endonuclease signature motif containing protein [Ornithinimicrobium tianjinense]|uniref:HNH nuclease domain-containing protein n=1 Tax=Ornithinimicrobium tianjinense TaxID=1195761 RepID=A0A917F8M1_9MICO|nr:HNH endonuclease signature motif containing protein [Ornithinimicrobium tianjinense]GGF56845.1 hypothetical protein GCM10011366_25870 [Ornithinimicrobium tianjinense]
MHEAVESESADAPGGGGNEVGGGEGRVRPSPQEMEAMGDEIARLAGQIAAATARFLRLLGEFEAVGGWGGPGIRSVAHWLSWRAGMSLRAAREHVRMARALRELPQTAAAFGAGELSFSKVRAITRVATPETEADLVALAKNAPAAHVERLVTGLRKVKRAKPRPGATGDGGGGPDPGGDPDPGGCGGPDPGGAAPEPDPAEPPPQSLQWRWDEENDQLVVWGRFGPADGRVLLAALTRAEVERVRTLEHEPEDDDRRGEDDDRRGKDDDRRSEAVDRTAPAPLQAGPALLALAQIGLTVQAAPEHAPAAEVIYLHQRVAGQEMVSADDGPVLDEGTGREVMCGARSRCVERGASGAVLSYGRGRRLFSGAQLRALHLRDRCCQTPGCQRTRFLHAHHVMFWSEGGGTDLDNAVLLCSACHRSVHLGRLRILALGGQRFRFVEGRTGAVLEEAPALFGQADQILADRTITARTVTGGWAGEPLDLSLATSQLIELWRTRASRPAAPWEPPRPWDDQGEGQVGGDGREEDLAA